MKKNNLTHRISERVSALQKTLRTQGLDYYYVPATDAHRNEYLPEHAKRREWISGFTGSAGDVVIGLERGLLWTDGRYVLQAEQELDPEIFSLIPQAQGVIADVPGWIRSLSKAQVQMGVDPQNISINQARELENALKTIGGRLVSQEINNIDAMRTDLATQGFCSPIRIHDVKYSGMSTVEKLAWLRMQMQEKGVEALVLNALDEIAWLFNIRGSDIDYNPVVVSYALITHQEAKWFVGRDRIKPLEIAHYCQTQKITAYDYEDFEAHLHVLKGLVWVDPHVVSFWIAQHLKHAQLHEERSPIVMKKACKNTVEIEGMIEAHLMDGVALTHFLFWLKTHWREGVTELSLAHKLHEFRAKSPLFLGESFRTISGFGPDGAVIHYSVTPESDRPVDDSSLFLLDSGAQYPMGTTDVTRVVHLGTPTPTQKRDYTLVLKGHLALRQAIFPQGANGTHVDILARQFLWQYGLNYQHGTGHGVGAHLCVHEGPQVISPRMRNTALMPGMVVSNEPGYYLKDHYGIRIENLCLVVEKQAPCYQDSPYGPFYGFEDLTFVPLAKNLMDLTLLSATEIQAINRYHQQVREKLLPRLDPSVHAWFIKATEAM